MNAHTLALQQILEICSESESSMEAIGKIENIVDGALLSKEEGEYYRLGYGQGYHDALNEMSKPSGEFLPAKELVTEECKHPFDRIYIDWGYQEVRCEQCKKKL